MKPGFILLEVLLSSALAALLSMSLIGIFQQLNTASRRADTKIDTSTALLTVKYVMERDLSGAFIPAPPEKKEKEEEGKKEATKEAQVPAIENIFYGTARDNQFDQLTFISNNPLKIYWQGEIGHAQPSLVRITYRLEPEHKKQKQPSFKLMRQESSDLEFAKDSTTTRAYEVVGNIRSMSVSYLPRSESQEKKEGAQKVWQIEQPKEGEHKEKESELHTKLPQLVTITIAFWQPNYKKSDSYTFSVPLFAEAFTPQEKKQPKSATKEAPNAQKPGMQPQQPAGPHIAAGQQPMPDIFSRLKVPKPAPQPAKNQDTVVLSKMRKLMAGLS